VTGEFPVEKLVEEPATPEPDSAAPPLEERNPTRS
jgi:hypothetical protein